MERRRLPPKGPWTLSGGALRRSPTFYRCGGGKVRCLDNVSTVSPEVTLVLHWVQLLHLLGWD